MKTNKRDGEGILWVLFFLCGKKKKTFHPLEHVSINNYKSINTQFRNINNTKDHWINFSNFHSTQSVRLPEDINRMFLRKIRHNNIAMGYCGAGLYVFLVVRFLICLTLWTWHEYQINYYQHPTITRAALLSQSQWK